MIVSPAIDPPKSAARRAGSPPSGIFRVDFPDDFIYLGSNSPSPWCFRKRQRSGGLRSLRTCCRFLAKARRRRPLLGDSPGGSLDNDTRPAGCFSNHRFCDRPVHRQEARHGAGLYRDFPVTGVCRRSGADGAGRQTRRQREKSQKERHGPWGLSSSIA